MAKPVALCAFTWIYATMAEVYLEEDFSGDWESRWVQSSAGSDLGKMKVLSGNSLGDKEAARGLQTTQDGKFYAISTATKEFSNEGKTLVVQYTVKHEQDIDCGGGYLKLGAFEQANFDGNTKYNIMFGPDICGSSTAKTHVILSYKGKPLEKHQEIRCESDTLSHLYTLIVRPDNTYEVQIDRHKVDSGALEDGWDFLEPKQIRDPDEKKPQAWVDEAEIRDPEDKQPEGYVDIPARIADPKATKPEDWDGESDGEWEAPQIDNPAYMGVWSAKRIKNPAYKGVWEAKLIANPEYEADDKMYSYSKFSTVGIDIWQVKSGTIFDNLLITDDEAYAKEHAAKTWKVTYEAEKAAKDKADKEKRRADEENRKAYEEDKTTKKEAGGSNDAKDDKTEL